ncbi:3-dehydroquinate dehydratase [Thermoleophilia bacterium SCSIO 60948]|nr:3-dehydroquinate dehydratase [Thermoleophilia bacterium SCSIO 60948]
MLGRRDPEHYGDLTLDGLEREVGGFARDLGLEARFFQTDDEAEMIGHLHRLPELADAVLINAGAWTHYSWALRDALEIAAVPAVEVHLSDVMSREEWRHRSVFEGLVLEAVSGRGVEGYRDGLERLRQVLDG